MKEYELKTDIGYNEELGEVFPFKVCSVEQMICQTKESLHPEEILVDKMDILEVRNALRITEKFLRLAKKTGCWCED